jgi:hypothetical protein
MWWSRRAARTSRRGCSKRCGLCTAARQQLAGPVAALACSEVHCTQRCCQAVGAAFCWPLLAGAPSAGLTPIAAGSFCCTCGCVGPLLVQVKVLNSLAHPNLLRFHTWCVLPLLGSLLRRLYRFAHCPWCPLHGPPRGLALLPLAPRYETQNHLWVILEYCVGGDLLALLRADGALPEASGGTWGCALRAALSVHAIFHTWVCALCE